VAIAATLLVLPLLGIARDSNSATIGTVLRENRSTFFAFVLSFVVIYRFWLVHHRIFGRASELSGALVWLNGLWLLSIAFLPFPTQLVGSIGDGRVVWGLYIGTMLVTVATSAACLWLVRRAGGQEPDKGSQTRILVITGAMAVAFVLGVAVPGAGPWALLLLFPAVAAQRITVPRGPMWIRRTGRHR
jgi:uncharacterized membrane protein